MYRTIFIVIKICILVACGKPSSRTPHREVQNPPIVALPSATAPVDTTVDTPDPSATDLTVEAAPAEPITEPMTDAPRSDSGVVSDPDQVDPASVDVFAKSDPATYAWPFIKQSQINVAVIGDSISQGSFAETTLGEPFPLRYAQFYDQNVPLLAWIKFAPSLDARTTLGHAMGRVFKDFWSPYSYVGNDSWGVIPQLQELFPSAEIKIHSQALMASTSYSIESQLNQLLSKQIAYDYFLIAIGSNDVCSSDVISPEIYGEKIRTALRRIRAQSAAPVLLLQILPIHKIMQLTDDRGLSILDKQIDYSKFHQHHGLSNLVAKFGLMPANCREHMRLECPLAVDSSDHLEGTVARFNQQLTHIAASFEQSRIIAFDPDIEIKPQDLAADCFHPNARLQKKFFESIDLRSLLLH